MELLRRVLLRCMSQVDRLYHRWHHLQPAGEVLVTGRQAYRGDRQRFPDGTCLSPGDPLGTLHFHNARISGLDGATSHRAAAQFGRLFLESLRTLAAKAARDPSQMDLVAYRGVSWLSPAVGARVGFVAQPIPDGMRKRFLSLYFRFLVWTFAPAPESREAFTAEPTVFWITRDQLLRHADDKPGGSAA